MTTAPAATKQCSPSSLPQTIVAFAPTEAAVRTSVLVTAHDPVARGVRSFVKTAAGPMKASFSS